MAKQSVKAVTDDATPPLAQNDAKAEKAAVIKIMKDAVAARHHGVLPKTMSRYDDQLDDERRSIARKS